VIGKIKFCGNELLDFDLNYLEGLNLNGLLPNWKNLANCNLLQLIENK
jgi:hypothetical protein